MKGTTKLVLFAAGVFAILSYAAPAFAGDQDFKLLNKTGYDIASVYAAPAHDDQWGDDIMGKEMLHDGSAVDINFSHKEDACHWDLKVVYADKQTAVWSDVNLCKTSNITLHWNSKTGETTADLN
jgi:hypothetical protein